MHCVVAAHCSCGSSFSVFRCFCCFSLRPPAAARRGRFLAALVAVALPPALSIIKNDVMDINICFCLKHTHTHSSASKSRQVFACEHVSALPFTTRRPCAPCTKPFRNQKLWKRRHVDGRCQWRRAQRIFGREQKLPGGNACLPQQYGARRIAMEFKAQILFMQQRRWSRHRYCVHAATTMVKTTIGSSSSSFGSGFGAVCIDHKQPQGQWCPASSNNATQ